jgi:hypothetical protein
MPARHADHLYHKADMETVKGAIRDAVAAQRVWEPSQTSHTVDSNSSDRTMHSNSLSKMFTSPTRPLFSRYEHVVPTDADGLPLDENLRRGAEEWLQRQREKDLRQALRLEKAFDEKRAGLGKRLE